MVTLVLMAGVSAMSMNMFLPALPAMSEYFSTDYKVMQLSVAIFLAVNAALQLIIGPLSDRFGRRPVVLAGTIIFILASFGTVHAPTVTTFLVLRAVQAAIVTGMVLSRAIVRDIHPGDDAATMIAYVTMGMSVVPMIAPSVGGVLTSHFGWQANFWVLTASGVGLLALVYFDLGETAPPQADRSLRAMFRAFPELLSSPRFLGYALSAAFASGAFFAYIGGAPFVGTTLFGLSEDVLGLHMAAPAVGYFFGNFAAGRYSARFGVNVMVLIGACILIVTVAINTATFLMGIATAKSFFGLMVFLGFGNGLQLPNSIAGSLSVRPQLAGTASGLGGVMMIGGGAALSAIAGSMLSVERGALPLMEIMLFSSIGSLIAILLVMRRERRVTTGL
ncbi:multidrug effflux MFS transporter [Celeribacter sp.]|uniref:multidrug effflux MFS transporter n=1 Tax=Celeribacter sp. TaxID=1890673 RepID=UPI003A91E29F